MNYTKVLFIIICIMFFIQLTDVTLFDSKWSGITLWINLGLLLFASAVLGVSRARK